MRKNLITFLIITATLVLGGIAIFTAWRLYQLRQQAVAPTAPESKPGAQAQPQTQACQTLTFTVSAASPTPTPPPGCYESCTPGGTDCPAGMACQNINGSNLCVNPACTGESDCTCAGTPTPTPTPTATPPTKCGNTCTTDSGCPASMVCYKTAGQSSGVCRNPSCQTETDCTCQVTQAPPELPEAGVSAPTIIGASVGALLILGALLLAL